MLHAKAAASYDRSHAWYGLENAPQGGLPQVGEAHLVVGRDKGLAQGGGVEQLRGVLEGVAAVELLLDVVGRRGVRANPVPLHGRDEVALRQLWWRLCHPLPQRRQRGCTSEIV